MKKSKTLIILLFIHHGFMFSLLAQSNSGHKSSPSAFENLVEMNQAANVVFQADLNRLLFDAALKNRYEANVQKYSSIKGSPYLFKNHRPGSIILNNDQVLHDVQLNYDALENSFVAHTDQEKIILLDPIYFKEVIIEDEHSKLVFKKSNPAKPNRFYHTLYDKDHLTFYKETIVLLREASNNGVLETPAQFLQKSKYFVVKMGSDPVAVHLKKRDLFDHFPEIERVAVNEIIKKKKIRLKKESDYEALLAQLDNK